MGKKKMGKPRTYLETLELSQFTFLGTVISPKERGALVSDSKGKAYMIREGMAIGTNGGIVFKIKGGKVIIREEYTDLSGNAQHRDITKYVQFSQR